MAACRGIGPVALTVTGQLASPGMHGAKGADVGPLRDTEGSLVGRGLGRHGAIVGGLVIGGSSSAGASASASSSWWRLPVRNRRSSISPIIARLPSRPSRSSSQGC